MTSGAPMPRKTEDYVIPAMNASTLEQTTSNALTMDGMRRRSDNTSGRGQQDEEAAKMSDACDTGADTYQGISGVGADNKGLVVAGFINAPASIPWQELDGIRADGTGSLAAAGVVNSFDKQELLETPSSRQAVYSQVIRQVHATGGSAVRAGYMNAEEQDYRRKQEILGINADRGSEVVAGVARNLALYQRSAIGNSRNDTRLLNHYQELGTPMSKKRTPGTSRLDLPGPRDKAVEAYSHWQQSKVADQTLKLEFQKARDVTLQDGLDLEQVFEDQDADFFIQSGVKWGVASQFIRDIEVWAEQYKSEYIGG